MQDHHILTCSEANFQFNIKEIFQPYHSQYQQYEKIFGQVVVLEGDTELDEFNEYEFAEHGGLVIVTGHLRVQNGFQIMADENGLRGMLVMGDVSSGWLKIGNIDFCITGNLTLTNYLYSPRPAYEQGVLDVKGETSVPIIVQEDYNPQLYISEGSGIYYGGEQLRGLSEEIYKESNFDIHDFIVWAKQEQIKNGLSQA